ncbi:MAG: PilW family protein [Opitutales bacterium]
MIAPKPLRAATGRARSGFTLIEVVVGIAIGGLVLYGMATAVFVVQKLYFDVLNEPFYEEHMQSVNSFMNYAFSSADVQADDSSEPNPLTGEEGDVATVTFRELPGAGFGDDALISFYLPGDLPILRTLETDEPPFGQVTGYLHFDDDAGLLLFWHGAADDPDEDPDIYQLLISPYVTGVEYCYYDSEDESWDIQDEPEEDGDVFQLPTYLRLTFDLYPGNEDEPRQLAFLLPNSSGGVPRP